jgi:hypothetical protein
MDDYNTCRPNSSVRYQTPAAYAETMVAMGSGMPDPIATNTQESVATPAVALIRVG